MRQVKVLVSNARDIRQSIGLFEKSQDPATDVSDKSNVKVLTVWSTGGTVLTVWSTGGTVLTATARSTRR